jgi:methylmalonyl-CoA/ethylmalonyl-CoA epimerase
MSPSEIDVRFNHLSIAVQDIDIALRFFRTALPIESETGKVLGSTGDFRWCQFRFGHVKLELIEAPHAESFVRRFIEKHGEGMHHLCFDVTQLEALTRQMEAGGLRIVDQRVKADDGSITASISPRSAHGVLIQLWQLAAPGQPQPERPRIVPFRLRSGEVVQLQFDHVSIAVRNIEAALDFFRRYFPITAVREPQPGYDGTFRFTDFLLNNCKLELIAPDETRQPGFVTRFLDRRGEGLHHLSIDVDRLDPLLAQLEADGIRIVDRFAFAEEWKTAFISPRSAHGVLIQFWQKPDFDQH